MRWFRLCEVNPLQANGWDLQLPFLLQLVASCSLLLEKLFMLTSQGRSEDLAMPVCARVCVCVAPLMSLRRATLICFVMAPIPEPCARARTADGEPTPWLSSHCEEKTLLFQRVRLEMPTEGDFPSPRPPLAGPLLGFPVIP